jgi:serine/threonine protein phosphatase PrpC
MLRRSSRVLLDPRCNSLNLSYHQPHRNLHTMRRFKSLFSSSSTAPTSPISTSKTRVHHNASFLFPLSPSLYNHLQHHQKYPLTTSTAASQAQPATTDDIGLDEVMPGPFDRGVFQTLGLSNDPIARSGFDRLIQYRITPDLWLFGVIDGHGSSSLCAEYLCDAFPVVIQLLMSNGSGGSGSAHHRLFNPHTRLHSDSNCPNKEETYLNTLREAFSICAKEWDRMVTSCADDRRHTGAVALLALVHGGQCYVASAGDCRAVISVSDGTFRSVNVPHRTDNPQERLRVLSRGGRIQSVSGVLRVRGVLIPTRAFGDISVRTDFFGNLKDIIAPEPDCVRVEPRKEAKGRHGKAYMLVASDGLWDTLPDRVIVSTISEGLCNKRSANDITQDLGRLALEQTDDDISILMLVW